MNKYDHSEQFQKENKQDVICERDIYIYIGIIKKYNGNVDNKLLFRLISFILFISNCSSDFFFSLSTCWNNKMSLSRGL